MRKNTDIFARARTCGVATARASVRSWPWCDEESSAGTFSWRPKEDVLILPTHQGTEHFPISRTTSVLTGGGGFGGAQVGCDESSD